MRETKVISLLGGSGLGKSTTAALLYGEMKRKQLSCELVREFVKDWAWEGKKPDALGQSIIYGRQLERESLLYGKVDYIITDSPLMLSGIYRNFFFGSTCVSHLFLRDIEEAKKKNVKHINFLLERKKAFSTEGRFEDEATAIQVDVAVKEFLKDHKIEFIKTDVEDDHRIDFIMNYLGLGE